MGVYDILWRCAIAMVAGWFIGFFSTRSALKTKYEASIPEPEGLLKLVYDVDDPAHPAIGLEIESLNYILNSDFVLLKIMKTGFPNMNKKVYLENKHDDA